MNSHPDANYTKRDISDLILEKHRTITYWTDFGLVIPDVEASRGRGKSRIYSNRNLVEFTMIQSMSIIGIKLETIRFIFQNLRAGYDIQGYADAAESGHVDPELLTYFNDFYKSSKWGREKELLYQEKYVPRYREVGPGVIHMGQKPGKLKGLKPALIEGPVRSFQVLDHSSKTNRRFKVDTKIEFVGFSINTLLLGLLKVDAAKQHWRDGLIPGWDDLPF